MDEKIEALKSALLRGFPKRKIQYQFANELHKFRIEGEKPTHWLYISREFVEDSNETFLIKEIYRQKIIDIFKKEVTSKWLFLGSKGVREVDENFAKPTSR